MGVELVGVGLRGVGVELVGVGLRVGWGWSW